MTARPMSFFKNKLREVSRQLYLENGWQMPRGLIDAKDRDPRNFTLDEWQQAKRIGRHAGELKELIQEAWAVSDSAQTFAHALEERGFYLARGDRRGHVAVTYEGEVISVARAIGKKSKDLQARLGKPDLQASVEDTRKRIANEIAARMQAHMSEARARTKSAMARQEHRRRAMADAHAEERAKLDAAQTARFEAEARMRAERFRKGMRGLWERLTGKRAKLEKQNQLEAIWALRRDQDQRQMVIAAQIRERQQLQLQIKAVRDGHAMALRALHFDLANYRLMRRGEEPRARGSFERAEQLRIKEGKGTERSRPGISDEKETARAERLPSQQERLRRLRERKQDREGPSSHQGPEFER